MLKLIGILLFLWILSQIDREALLLHLKNADLIGIAAALLGLFVMYALKAARWHLLVRSTGLTPSPADSWRLFNIGIFLGAITPANMGEMGRAAYLRRSGLHAGTALALPLIDRIADVSVMGAVGIWSVGLLFGWRWSLLAGCSGIIGTLALVLLWRRMKGLREREWFAFMRLLAQPRSLAHLLFWTILSWVAYFGWTFVMARSIGIEVDLLVLMATLTLTGILVFIPIAPSGLGTREAAFITLLAPYGVEAPEAVALALLMFFLILASSLPGLWYWLHPKEPAASHAHSR